MTPPVTRLTQGPPLDPWVDTALVRTDSTCHQARLKRVTTPVETVRETPSMSERLGKPSVTDGVAQPDLAQRRQRHRLVVARRDFQQGDIDAPEKREGAGLAAERRWWLAGPPAAQPVVPFHIELLVRLVGFRVPDDVPVGQQIAVLADDEPAAGPALVGGLGVDGDDRGLVPVDDLAGLERPIAAAGPWAAELRVPGRS